MSKLATDWSATEAWVAGAPIVVACKGCGSNFDYRQREVNPYTMWSACPHCHCSDVKNHEPIDIAIGEYHRSQGWTSRYTERFEWMAQLDGDVQPDIIFDTEGGFRIKPSNN